MSFTSSSMPTVVQAEQSFIRRVFNWMVAGLGLSALISFYLLQNPDLLRAYFSSPLSFILPIGELILVFWLSSRVHRMSNAQGTFFFFLYAALNGITLTPLLIQYTRASIFSTFCVTAATFGITSFYGYMTKKDLSSMGGYVTMGLIGLIVASLVNLFFQSPAIYWILTYAGVGLSIAVTAYYMQGIKRMSQGLSSAGDVNTTPAAILGALMLYVAFIMMFVYLLRILGDRR